MPHQDLHWTLDSELLDRYVLRKLEVNERAKLDAHLRECEQCAQNVRAEQKLVAGVRSLGRDQLKARLGKRLGREESRRISWTQAVGIAAAVVFLVSIGIYNRWFFPRETEQAISDLHPKETTPAEPAEKVLPNAMREEMKTREPRPEGVALAPRPGIPSSTSPSGVGERERQPSIALEMDRSKESQIAPLSVGKGAALRRESQPTGGYGMVSTMAEKTSRERWVEGVILPVETQATTKDEMTAARAEKSLESARARKMDADALARESAASQVIRLGNEMQIVTLGQRSVAALPRVQQEQRQRSRQRIQAFVETTDRGLRMTLYLEELVPESRLQTARIEPVTEDSLILHFGEQRVGFNIPGGWGEHTGKNLRKTK
ncbi:MAG TPA: hypothetical protein DCP63_04725 [Bacteroidetes bacterium]|nr:hypothetical protein [Bacteroidota bacterium]